MSNWPSKKGRQVFRALLHIGWTVKKHNPTSHKVLVREGWPDYVFAFGESEEIGPAMMAKIAKHTGLKPQDL